MTALRSRRLEALFGVPLDDLKTAHIQQLVTNAVTEAFDLDYKRTTYGSSDGDKRALRVDVAALANTAGGVIVIGVAEDTQARAAAAPGVPLSDGEIGRMRQIVAPGVSPMPVLDILSIPDETDPALGFYVIAVPRSPSAPHAVLVGDSLRYPKRNGATTRYLSEPELAMAYRDRTAGGARQKSRIAEIETEAIDRLTLNGPWLVLSLVPDLPGDLLISASTYGTFENEMRGRRALQMGSSQFMRTSVGRGRFLADGGGRTPLAEWCSLELHTDGSGVFGLRLWDMYEGKRQEGQSVTNLVADESLAWTMMGGLVWLGSHAQGRAAAGGNAVVRAQLVPESGASSMEIGHTRFFGTAETRSAVGQDGITHVAETVAALDDLTTGCPGLAVVIAALGNELGQSFGIPELGQFTSSGELNLQYWGRESHQSLLAWAEQHGIGVLQQG
jgi:hypothetical protein